MPETSYTNGYVNGHVPYDMEDGSNFLFTSESVGEGHPGECIFRLRGQFNMAPAGVTLVACFVWVAHCDLRQDLNDSHFPPITTCHLDQSMRTVGVVSV